MPVEPRRLQAEYRTLAHDPDELTTDENGLVLWGGVDLDLTLSGLQKKVCAVCGAPATVATRKLDQQLRSFLCDVHQISS